jgi:uncharacterized membrane protein YfcA
VTVAFGAVAVMLAAFVKGAVAFGFPTVATPLLALITDVKTAVAISILPNIVMDGIQAVRRPGALATIRRHAVLYAMGIVGTVLGTYLLARFSDRHSLLLLGGFVLAFVAINLARPRMHVRPEWAPYLPAPVGLVAGLVGGVTNVHGTPLVLYFYALGMEKTEFVRAIALAFLVYKAAQLAAVVHVGMMTAALFGWSVLATLAALVGFGLGLRVQDRMNQATFNRVVLVVLAALGVFLVARGIR